MRSPVLYFFLLVLRVFFNLIPDIIYKRGGFSEILLEEGFKFVSCECGDPVLLNLGLVLLLAEVDLIAKEQSRKENALVTRGTGHVEIILTLPIEVVALYVRAPIVQVGVFGLEGTIAGRDTCLELGIFLALNKQF